MMHISIPKLQCTTKTAVTLYLEYIYITIGSKHNYWIIGIALLMQPIVCGAVVVRKLATAQLNPKRKYTTSLKSCKYIEENNNNN